MKIWSRQWPIYFTIQDQYHELRRAIENTKTNTVNGGDQNEAVAKMAKNVMELVAHARTAALRAIHKP